VAASGVALPRSSGSVVVTLLAFALVAAVLLASGRRDYPYLHVVLDTAMCLLSGVLALLLWDLGTSLDEAFPRWVALTFAGTFVLELVHVLVAVEWFGTLAPIAQSAGVLRPSTWPPAAYLLPLGVGGSLWLLRRGARQVAGFGLALVLAGGGLLTAFSWLPRYTPPTWLGVTRPTLVLVPMLWALVGLACWRLRASHRMLPILAAMAPVFLLAHVSMLYSRAPHDTEAMVAHLGKVGGGLLLLLSLMLMASVDVLARRRADQALATLNAELEQRVAERTEELGAASVRIRGQVERLNLLHQITHAIGERQDLNSILQVVVRSLEDHLPVDFSCVCLYDQAANTLVVTSVGLRSEPLALELALTDQSRVKIDENGLSRCVHGELVYEPDIRQAAAQFPSLLARGGLGSLVVAPLRAESRVFGVVIAARRQPSSFSSGECEFMRQLSEHTALAAHQAQLHDALQAAYDDLRRTQQIVMQQERLRALGQMASGIAHDINNAILPVMLYTDSLLEEEPNLSPRARGDLETIARAVADVAQTVARLGEFYRARESAPVLVSVQVNQLIEQVIDLTRARWSDMPQRRGVVIRMRPELAPDLPAVLGVESEIREALINLVFNAVDAMPEGGQITLGSSFDAGAADPSRALMARQVHVEVADTGAGMDEETRRRCLEPFFTTKGERGTGLGLAMVYGIAQRHGGGIDIDSVPGQGTTVRLSFSLSTAGTEPHRPAAAGPVPRLRILVIDDDPLILRAVRDILEGDGHTVVGESGGQLGIDAFRAALARNEAFALVITDLGMPHVDGRQVASAVKQASPSTPIVLLTGWGRRLMAEGEVPPQVDRVVSKPPTLRQLREALAYCYSLGSTPAPS
jgi:signal transduction histidine kinase/ActR/RegA family two-component response regulator